MAGKTFRLAGSALFAWLAFGQPSAPPGTDKTFYLTHTDTHGLQQIASVVRSIGDIRDVSVDEAKAAIAVHATAEQIAMAGWLAGELDQVPAAAAHSARHEYPGTISGGEVMHVYFLTGPQTPGDLQEILNLTRSVADIQRLYPYFPLRAIAARGSPDQAALTDWMTSELNGPAKPGTQVSRPYTDPIHRRNEVAQVFFLSNTQTPQAVQEIVNSTRSITDIQRVFPYHAARALAMRGPADQIAFADWLLKELDKPAALSNPDSSPHEYQVPATLGPGIVARVFYLSGPPRPQFLQDLVKAVRTATNLQRVYPIHQVNAVTLRGTGDQIARAEQVIHERAQ
jgi:hypothetical protein